MKLEHLHKVVVVFCLASLLLVVADARRVMAQDPPPKLLINTGMDGTEIYCLGQTIELAALVTDAYDPTVTRE